MKDYTLVLYKSDGCNTCRGCVMEQWGSDFSLDTDVSEEDAIERIAEAFTRPSEGGSYTAHLIGVIEEKREKYDNAFIAAAEQTVYEFDQYNNASWQQQVGGVSVRSNNHEAHWEDVEIEGKRINQLIRSRVAAILDAQLLASEKAKQEEKEKEAKKKELYERQQLAALQQKYKEIT